MIRDGIEIEEVPMDPIVEEPDLPRKIRVEFDDEDGLIMIRPHRIYFTGDPKMDKKALPLELEFKDEESLFGFIPQPGEELKGRSAQVKEGAKGLILTADPDLYGTDDERAAEGKMKLSKCPFGQFTALNADDFCK